MILFRSVFDYADMNVWFASIEFVVIVRSGRVSNASHCFTSTASRRGLVARWLQPISQRNRTSGAVRRVRTPLSQRLSKPVFVVYVFVSIGFVFTELKKNYHHQSTEVSTCTCCRRSIPASALVWRTVRSQTSAWLLSSMSNALSSW